ncbi:MAG: DNA protecting protein DprA [Candidatus Yanofskybacteria bacterium RIFCSPLOWO2_02_FULL_43_10]|uniref:DNA protecting protein DprA n=1 Tax=Candidatus Yanofskybacteria bacterium RIFCSPLOWO2_12_FULL_43_11b TaxID=1802710 RepID=A0A1F8HBH3_9BACT|nr:MAG: DNA protecting protein DprA [Candidatus Yanofskybacteria bacterium RIFCSPHIGHO2_01_FULL_43_32]OGN11526.1 MAG: DNA protecting protein DprA [Candidatus Yanofskybacteria bacterium RIFCSPHIGHO2_02_FULL_43_12]OGN18393.1 MAG: DNA protecting protein DprA [Candidatus Yanofskybacteria bacterium RIFCSPHIGHO2_12_FULL_43_11]OGN24862.1 MAG: DNA protecting protein DprA [Candidatus Yanofskybacteria bacterium RIFCSPLOWO2_01_FULL_43_46]OGN29606.1 MAG: DNA protecting protein DprA [Candidatus Yanofskybact
MNWPIVQVDFGKESFSKLLSQIHDSPKQLYCRGNISLLNSSCFAVVGTRKLTSYGKETAQQIVRDLANNGFTIVSGLALGIDAVAHQATLDCGGKTIAVLGGGVGDKNIGPRTNFALAQSILKNDGLLVSEYSERETIFASNFAARDRIISGLSLGVLVIEADEKSGALITAKCALDQNRDVFAVPGSVLSPKSAGPNALIQNGAKLVVNAYDIINEYHENLQLFSENKKMVLTQNPTEKKIVNLLDEHGILFVDDIIRRSGMETSAISVSLSMLEIRGIIKHLGNGKYRKI